MITGIHNLIFTQHADAVRAFFKDVLELPFVDAGGGWPIYGLPPSELGIHPDEGPDRHELWLMCDNLESTLKDLAKKGVHPTDAPKDQGWGIVSRIQIPNAGQLYIYQPRHPSPK